MTSDSPTPRAHETDTHAPPKPGAHHLDLSARRQSILVVDDAPLSSALLAELLVEEYEVLIASDGTQALDLATLHEPDLILLDVLLPDMNGYEVLRRLKADARTAHTPVIFITGLDRPEDEVRSLTQGASDFIAKPFIPQVVCARVDAHMRLARLVAHLEHLANVDGLTGISNRRQFDEVLTKELRRSRRNNTPLSVAVVDIDFFKQYNDSYGHVAGDEALRTVANVLKEQLKRPGDLVARYGGEEFVLVLPETSAVRAIEFARCLCDAVRAAAIPHQASKISDVLSVSIGVAGTEEYDATLDRQTLVEAADARLYEAKRAGRNRAIGPATVEA